MNNARKLLASKIKSLRKKQDKSQLEFSMNIGINNKYYSDIERGVRNCTIDVIEKIATGLKVPIVSLFEDERYVEDTQLTNELMEVMTLLKDAKSEELQLIYQVTKDILTWNKSK